MADINKTVVPADAFSTVDHDEYAAAEAQAKESVGNYTLKLKRPFTFEGQTFDELNFDFEGLTGDDALAIEDELQAIGKPTISPTFSGQFLVRMAARACTNTIIDASGRPRRIGDDALRALPIFEFNRVRGKGSLFFAGIGAVTGDGGVWLRRQCLTMAKTNQTPVSYWLSLPLPSLCKWIKVSNQLVKEARERRKNK